VFALCILLFLALFLIRPGADGLRTRIVRSISLALGRPVEVASVSLRLLPQPGFELQNFVVHDDSAFSAEPMLRADEVTALLRVSSLLRGHLEIARLTLTEPSLNLVRNSGGHWNLENILERVARTPVAPTAKTKAEKRPGFPYIEARHGRINFKFVQEKKPYALSDADFALWQDSDNAWGLRLEAQPLRADFNLSDTGTIKLSGSWQRAAVLRDTPIQLEMNWDGGQLGQMTKLAYGNDKGWRGTVSFSTTLSGTPANLTVASEASVQDFHRYDVGGGGATRLGAQCSGHYSSVDHTIGNLVCWEPVGDGVVTLKGNIASLMGARTYDLLLAAEDVPMQSLVAVARHAKKDLPEDLTAMGKVNAHVELRQANPGDPGEWHGGGEVVDVQLGSKTTNIQLAWGRIPFTAAGSQKVTPNVHSKASALHRQPPPEARIEMGPFALAMGRPAPAAVQGWVSRSGYSLGVTGDAQIQRLLQLAKTVGLAAPHLAAAGTAQVGLQIAGQWSGFAAPSVTGSAQLRSIRAEVRGLNAPLEITTANLLLASDEISIQNLAASAGGATWRGSMLVPRMCGEPGGCPIHFDLHADEISTDELNQLLNPHPSRQPWYRFLSPAPAASVPYLLTLRGTGKLAANRVLIHKLLASHVSANVELDRGRLRLSDLRADVLGGRHAGEWKMDFTLRPPEYTGSGRLDRAALGQLAEMMHDGWVTGTASTAYRATTSGLTQAELLRSANATLELEAHDGSLPHLALAAGSDPLRILHFAAQLLLRDGKVEIQQGKLETPGSIYQMSGTVSLVRKLDVKLLRDRAHGFSISGTLTEPRIAPVIAPETQAAIKP
jgi:hypothetical protein